MIPSEEGFSMGSLEVVLDFVPALELRCAAKLSLSGVCTVLRQCTVLSNTVFPC